MLTPEFSRGFNAYSPRGITRASFPPVLCRFRRSRRFRSSAPPLFLIYVFPPRWPLSSPTRTHPAAPSAVSFKTLPLLELSHFRFHSSPFVLLAPEFTRESNAMHCFAGGDPSRCISWAVVRDVEEGWPFCPSANVPTPLSARLPNIWGSSCRIPEYFVSNIGLMFQGEMRAALRSTIRRPLVGLPTPISTRIFGLALFDTSVARPSSGRLPTAPIGVGNFPRAHPSACTVSPVLQPHPNKHWEAQTHRTCSRFV